MVGIPGDVGVWRQAACPQVLAYQDRRRPRTRVRNLPKPERVLELAKGLFAEAWAGVMWREGAEGRMFDRFVCFGSSHRAAIFRVRSRSRCNDSSSSGPQRKPSPRSSGSPTFQRR